jgi:hypothetical protein
MKRVPFTPSEDRFIREWYDKIPGEQIAKALGRPRNSPRARMKVLGLVVPDEVRDRIKREAGFQPGHTLHKGMKEAEFRSADHIAKLTTHRQNQRGKPAHTAKPDGTIRMWKQGGGEKRYFVIRVKAKWVLLHRHLWEQAHGPIPEGYRVAFINQDQTDVRLENLELTTTSKMMKDRHPDRYSPEMTEVMKAHRELMERVNDLIKKKQVQQRIIQRQHSGMKQWEKYRQNKKA